MPSLKVHFYLTVFLSLPFVLSAADIGQQCAARNVILLGFHSLRIVLRVPPNL